MGYGDRLSCRRGASVVEGVGVVLRARIRNYKRRALPVGCVGVRSFGRGSGYRPTRLAVTRFA